MSSASPQVHQQDQEGDGDQEGYLDILGNKLILKKTLTTGLGRDSRPNHGEVVTISCRGRLDDGTDVDCHDELTFILGDGDVIQAFDLALSLSERQEEFELISEGRFAYGEKGRDPDIPPDARITFWVKLLHTDDAPDYSQMSPERLIEEANKKRDRGNFLYRREEFAFSVNSYMKAQTILDNCAATPAPSPTTSTNQSSADDETTSSSTQLIDTQLKVANNLAAAQLKIEAFDAAIESCNFVLLHDPENVKAIFRKGKAFSGKGDHSEAIMLLKKALLLEPGSRLAAIELARSRTLWQQECDQRARVCKRMFGKMSEMGPNANGANGSGPARSKMARFGMIAGGVVSLLASIGLAVAAVKYNAVADTAPIQLTT